MAHASNIKESLGSIYFKGKHLLTFEAILEYSENSHLKDVVFLEIREDMRSGNDAVIRMALSIMDLYHFVHAIDEVVHLAEQFTSEQFKTKCVQEIKQLGAYRKFTKSAHFSTKLFLGVKKELLENNGSDSFKTRFYLNIQRDKKTVVLGLNTIELLSMQDRLRHFAAHVDTSLWKAQNTQSTKGKNDDV